MEAWLCSILQEWLGSGAGRGGAAVGSAQSFKRDDARVRLGVLEPQLTPTAEVKRRRLHLVRLLGSMLVAGWPDAAE